MRTHQVAKAVVTDSSGNWQSGDLEAMIALVSKPFVLEGQADLAVVDHAGIALGREAVRQALSAPRSSFAYIRYRAAIVKDGGPDGGQRVEFIGAAEP